MKLKTLLSAAIIAVTANLTAQNTVPVNGNVGIGTINPTAKLDVNGHTKIDSTLIVKDSVRFKSRLTVDEKVVFKQNAVVKGQMFRAEHNAKIQNNLRVNNNIRVDNVLRVDGLSNFQGNVKMPNISPLNNNANDFTFLIKKPNGQVKTMTKAQFIDIAYSKYDCTDPNITIANPTWSNGTNKIYTDICNVVNVGIGTSTPQYKLDVRGVTYSNRLLVGKLGSLTNATINGFDNTNSRDLIQLGVHNSTTGGQADVRFKVNHNGNLRINSKGGNKIFVAKNSAGYKVLQLESNGLLRARKIRVDEVNWADYVFNKDYVLKPLSELENFIKLNKHLPNIPTAKDIEKNGVDVSDMQRLQMEKIEELTLYTIEQEQKIVRLQKQVEILIQNKKK